MRHDAANGPGPQRVRRLAGTFSFPMQVQDAQGNIVSGTVTVTINP